MPRKKSLAVNYLLNTSCQIFLLAVPLITTPYLSRTLGAGGVGVYSYTYAMVSYFLLFAVLGTNTYGQRAIAYVQDDKYLRSCRFFEILAVRLLAAAVCSLAYLFYILTPFCKYRPVAWIQILWLAGTALDLSWLFQGLEDFKSLVARNALARVLHVVLICGCIRSPSDVGKYALILSGVSLLASLSMWPCLPKIIGRVKPRDVRPFRDIREMLVLFVPAVAVQINAVFDKTMIGWFAAGPAENGYYEQTEKVVRVALAVVTSLSAVMIPRIAKLYQDRRTGQIRDLLGKSYQFVWFAGIPAMLGLLAVMDLFVPVFYGPGYERMEALMPVYLLCMIPVALSNVTGCQFLIPTRRQNVYTVAVAVGAAVNVLCNCLLIPRFQAGGAVAASVLAEYTGAVILLAYVQKNRLVELSAVFSGSLKKWAAGAGMFLCVRWTGTLLDASAGSLALLILEGAAVYAVLLFLQKDSFALWIAAAAAGKVHGMLPR